MKEEKKTLLMGTSVLEKIDANEKELIDLFHTYRSYLVLEDVNKMEKTPSTPLFKTPVFEGILHFDEMLGKVQEEGAANTLYLTALQERGCLAELYGIDTCFYNTGCNDCYQVDVSHEVRNAKELRKILK